MWLPDAVALATQRNAVVPLGFQLIDEIDGSFVDLTGCAITMAVATGAGIAPTVTIAGIIDDPANGGFAVTINGPAFSAIVGTQETIVLSYDVRITDTAGNKIVVMRGPLMLEPGVNV